jgi:excisionase family DNA binding protein
MSPAAAAPPRLFEVSSHALLGLAEAPVRPPPLKPLLEVIDVARYLGVTPDCVRRLIRLRRLSAIRVANRWRVDSEDLQAFCKGARQPAIVTPRSPSASTERASSVSRNDMANIARSSRPAPRRSPGRRVIAP